MPFRLLLACPAAWAGKRVEAVSAAYTSQECSGCGERMRKRLSVCTPVCPTCGRPHAGPRCERGVAHALARAAPAGTRGGAGGEEPRTRGALAHAECQKPGLVPDE